MVHRLIGVIGFCVLMAVGCAHNSAASAAYATEEPTLLAAQQAFERGDYPNAALQYKNYLRNAPQGETELYASHWLARSYYAMRRYQDAQPLFEHVASSDNQWTDEAQIYQGLSELRMGQEELALSTWHAVLDKESCRRHVNDELVEGVVRAAQLAHERALGLIALDRLERCGLSRDQEQRFEQGVDALLSSKTSISENLAALDQLKSSGTLWRRLALATLEQARTQQKPETAQQIEAMLRSSPQADQSDVARALSLANPTLSTGSVSVAVLLPLSGRGRLAGREVLGGMELAQRSAEFLVQDSEQPQGELIDRLRQQFQGGKVRLVIGPMNPKLLEAVSALAAEYNLPVIGLTSAEVKSAGANAYRALPTIREEIHSLLSAAGASKKIGLIYADQSYGQTVAKAVRAELQSQRRTLCADSMHPASNTINEEMAKAISKERCDAYVIADQPNVAAVLASMLSAQGKTVLLPSAAYTTELQAEASRSLRHALVALPFETTLALTSESFEQTYKDRNGKAPGMLAYVGNQLATLITELHSSGATSASAFSQALSARTSKRTRSCKPFLASSADSDAAVCVFRFDAAGPVRVAP